MAGILNVTEQLANLHRSIVDKGLSHEETASASASGQSSFGSYLNNNLNSIKTGDAMLQAGAADLAAPVEVSLAVAEATRALEQMVTLRDKGLGKLESVMGMQIG
jgi:flagellar hook-basal body complex protein FliE